MSNATLTKQRLSKSSLAAATLMSCALAAPLAEAKSWLVMDETVGTVEGWTVGYSSGMAGCLATARYKDKTRMWFGHSHRLAYFVAFTNPKWDVVRSGTNYNLQLSLDDRGTWNGKFTGFRLNGRKGLATSNLKDEFIAQFAASDWMQVKASGKEITSLSLDGSRAALQAIANCNARFSAQAREDLARSRRAPDQGADREPRQHARRRPQQPPHNQPRQDKPKIMFGTGFFVNAKGYLVTNHHVAGSCRSIKVGYSGGLLYTATLVASDKRNDLAVLKTELAPKYVPSIRRRIRVGENIYTFGFPLTGLLSKTGNFTVGYVTAAAGIGDDTSLMQISAPVQPGNSGGALVDAFGNVVGVIVSKLNALAVAKHTNDVPQNVNFAIKSSIMIGFLEANGIELPDAAPVSNVSMGAGRSEPGSKLSPADIAAHANQFTVRIICQAR